MAQLSWDIPLSHLALRACQSGNCLDMGLPAHEFCGLSLGTNYFATLDIYWVAVKELNSSYSLGNYVNFYRIYI